MPNNNHYPIIIQPHHKENTTSHPKPEDESPSDYMAKPTSEATVTTQTQNPTQRANSIKPIQTPHKKPTLPRPKLDTTPYNNNMHQTINYPR
mmetsp:Transcript_10672/g.16280  ORF Transcript_10672/g.16280 Transcript_10672/m.16280 type:complete len:92 (-) Transcript_10672:633-908(-)